MLIRLNNTISPHWPRSFWITVTLIVNSGADVDEIIITILFPDQSRESRAGQNQVYG